MQSWKKNVNAWKSSSLISISATFSSIPLLSVFFIRSQFNAVWILASVYTFAHMKLKKCNFGMHSWNLWFTATELVSRYSHYMKGYFCELLFSTLVRVADSRVRYKIVMKFYECNLKHHYHHPLFSYDDQHSESTTIGLDYLITMRMMYILFWFFICTQNRNYHFGIVTRFSL